MLWKRFVFIGSNCHLDIYETVCIYWFNCHLYIYKFGVWLLEIRVTLCYLGDRVKAFLDSLV